MSELLVFLAGEGRNDLGSWARERAYQNDSEPGVVKALLTRTREDGWRVCGAKRWKDIRKFTPHGHHPVTMDHHIRSSHEAQTVLGLILDAKESGAGVVAFVRDQDGHPDRSARVDLAIERARSMILGVRVVGGTAVPVLEGWILALMGVGHTEELTKSKAQDELAIRKVTTTEAMVAVVLDRVPVPDDARHLKDWLATAKDVLTCPGPLAESHLP